MTVASIILGAIYRRFKGGWCDINSTVLRVVGFLIPLTICLVLGFPVILSVALASFVTFGFLMPKHGYGIAMGRDPAHPLYACIIVMLAQYGGLTLLAGIVWEVIEKGTGGLFYAPMGCIIPLGYWGAWKLWERLKLKPFGEYPKGNWFADEPTAFGECILGGILVGGIPLAHFLAV